MTDPVGAIMAALENMLRAKSGSSVTDCTMPAKRFDLWEGSIDDCGKGAAAQRPRPFTVADPTTDTPGGEPAFMDGDHTMRASRINIAVAYAKRPKRRRTLQIEQRADLAEIARVVEHEGNIALVSGWTMSEVVSDTVRDIGDDDPPSAEAMIITLAVEHREQRLS